ncbi:helix-turn-helix transcriptional regulator [Streptomyces sp. NPDC051909]|uniref:helix-turn-helix domain-containing protein n=1 Tax=Streptomyces sp. NPDC051909 TaxID=3154944 RepID=UPI0034196B14
MQVGERGSKGFGALLRFFRQRAEMTQEALGARLGFSKSQVAMVERGDRRPRGKFVPLSDDVLRAQGALIALAKQEFPENGLRQWTENYLEEEAKAVALHAYQNHVVPGALQTKAYAQAVYTSNRYPTYDDEEVEKQSVARLKRQQLFHRKPAPNVSFVVEYSALTRPIGGAAVLKQQLHHILGIQQLRHVEIQVMPHDRETHAGLNGPLIILETAKRQQLAYVEGHRGGYFVSEQPDLADLIGKYGILRAQALTPEESARLIEQVAEAL